VCHWDRRTTRRAGRGEYVDGVAQPVAVGQLVERKTDRVRGGRGDGEQHVLGAGGLGRDHEDRGPAEVGESESSVGVALPERVGRDHHAAEQLAVVKNVDVVRHHEIGGIDLAV
jgi:hypothetical protein